MTNAVVGLDGAGNAGLFADYMQWENWRLESRSSMAEERERPEKSQQPSNAPAAAKKKLSYIEQREYDGLEARIEEADARLREAHNRVNDPAVGTNAQALTEALAELEAAQQAHDAIYERWAVLTEKIEG